MRTFIEKASAGHPSGPLWAQATELLAYLSPSLEELEQVGRALGGKQPAYLDLIAPHLSSTSHYVDLLAAGSQDRLLLEFFQGTYEAAATLGSWDCQALEPDRYLKALQAQTGAERKAA